MPNEILELTEKFMKNPYRILFKNVELTLEGIRQFYVLIENEKQKFEILCDLFGAISITQSIIYCNSKKKVYYLTQKMQENNFSVSCIYGDMPQDDRNKVMESFRYGETRVLITTDILSRGIDVQQVSLVMNFDIPNEIETYIHRIGRSGRFGRKGMAINLITNYDWDHMQHVVKFYSTQIEELPMNFDEYL